MNQSHCGALEVAGGLAPALAGVDVVGVFEEGAPEFGGGALFGGGGVAPGALGVDGGLSAGAGVVAGEFDVCDACGAGVTDRTAPGACAASFSLVVRSWSSASSGTMTCSSSASSGRLGSAGGC